MRVRAQKDFIPAPTYRTFEDAFSQSSVANASRIVDGSQVDWAPGYWLTNTPNTATVTESGGSLKMVCPGDTAFNRAEVIGSNDYGLNFFANPVLIRMSGLVWDVDAAGGLPFQHRLTFSITSTRENPFTAPSAVKFWLQESERFSLSVKAGVENENPENESELISDIDTGAGGGEVSATFSAAPAEAYLILDRTSYYLSVSSPGQTVYRTGEHGLNAADWGRGFHLGVEGLWNDAATSANSASYTLGGVSFENLLAFDAFQNSTVVNSGYQYQQYAIDVSNTDTSPTATDGLLLTADGTGSTRETFVTSKVTPLCSPFINTSIASAELTFSGTAGSGEQFFKYYLCSEQKNPTASTDCILVRIAASGAWAVNEKINGAGTDPEAVTPRAFGNIGATPTSFSFQTDKDGYILTINGAIRSSTTHQFYDAGNALVSSDEFKFGVTGGKLEPGHAAYGFGLKRDAAANTAVCLVQGFQIARITDDANYIAPSTFGPVGDGVISLPVPALPRAQWKAKWGILDVTKAPFYADPTGVLDSTNALNHALHVGRDHQLVVFFPQGTYSVSGPLSVFQQQRIRTNGNLEAAQRNASIRIQGSYSGTRPKIRLAANSFTDDSSQDAYTPVIELYGRKSDIIGHFNANDGMENIISNLDVEVLAGNPGAIGVRAQGAQGCELRDMTIDLSLSGARCIDGGPGSGGGITNVHCIGGDVGLEYYTSRRPASALNDRDAAGAQPVPVVRACRFEGQRDYAIRAMAPQPVILVGCEIDVPASSTTDVAIYSHYATGGWTALRGRVALVDTRITFETYSAANVALQTASCVYMSNVYIERAGTSVEFNASAIAASGSGAPADLAGFNGLRRVDEFAAGVRPNAYGSLFGTRQFQSPTYVDGVRSTAQRSDTTTVGVTVPATLRTARAITFPHFEQGAINVKDWPYSAAGDGITDDTAAINSALTAAGSDGAVFFPKGVYVVRDTLDVPTNCTLIGAHRSYSQLIVVDNGVSNVFQSDASPAPILRTANSASAAPKIVDLTLHAPTHYDGAYALNVRSGQALVWGVHIEDRSDYGFGSNPGKPTFDRRTVSLCYYSDNGGGVLGHMNMETHWEQTADSRHFLFDGLTQPLEINALNVEHGKMDANVEFRNCSGQTEVFGFKCEGPYNSLWLSQGTNNFRLYGFGGNFTGVPSASWNQSAWNAIDVGDAGGNNPAPSNIDYTLSPTPIRIDIDCYDYVFALVGQTGEKSAAYSNVFVRGFDPSSWSIVFDDAKSESPADVTPALDWPVLYKREAVFVPPPSTSSLSPDTGTTAGGTTVTATGDNYTGTTGVTVGGNPATGVTVNTDEEVEFTTPAGSAGAQNVIVTTPAGSSAPATFTYTAASARFTAQDAIDAAWPAGWTGGSQIAAPNPPTGWGWNPGVSTPDVTVTPDTANLVNILNGTDGNDYKYVRLAVGAGPATYYSVLGNDVYLGGDDRVWELEDGVNLPRVRWTNSAGRTAPVRCVLRSLNERQSSVYMLTGGNTLATDLLIDGVNVDSEVLPVPYVSGDFNWMEGTRIALINAEINHGTYGWYSDTVDNDCLDLILANCRIIKWRNEFTSGHSFRWMGVERGLIYHVIADAYSAAGVGGALTRVHAKVSPPDGVISTDIALVEYDSIGTGSAQIRGDDQGNEDTNGPNWIDRMLVDSCRWNKNNGEAPMSTPTFGLTGGTNPDHPLGNDQALDLTFTNNIAHMDSGGWPTFVTTSPPTGFTASNNTVESVAAWTTHFNNWDFL